MVQIEMEAPKAKRSRPGPSCKVCIHPKRAEIEQAIVAGVLTNNDISTKLEVSWQSVHRHRINHMAPAAVAAGVAAAAEVEAERSGSLLEQAQSLARDARGILDGATKDGQRETALKAIREVSRLIELQGKLLGTIDNSVTLFNVMLAPALLELQTCILSALANHPEARRDVVLALGRLSGRDVPLLIEHEG